MSRNSVLFLLFLGAATQSASCGSPSGQDAGPAEIEMGTGSLAFESLAENASLELVAGTQGGYHFIANARIRGLLPGNPSVPNQLGNPITTFSILDSEGTRLDAMSPPYRLGYREGELAPWFEMPSGRILQINQDLVDADEAFLPALYQREILLRVEVRDARGDTASDERWIRPEESQQPDAGLFQDAGVDAGT